MRFKNLFEKITETYAEVSDLILDLTFKHHAIDEATWGDPKGYAAVIAALEKKNFTERLDPCLASLKKVCESKYLAANNASLKQIDETITALTLDLDGCNLEFGEVSLQDKNAPKPLTDLVNVLKQMSELERALRKNAFILSQKSFLVDKKKMSPDSAEKLLKSAEEAAMKCLRISK